MNILPIKQEIIIVTGIVFLVLLLVLSYRSSTSDNNPSSKLGIKELINKVRSELVETNIQLLKEDKPALFEVREFELELNFVIKESTNDKAGFEFNAVTVGSDTEFSSEKLQKITLKMTAVPPEEGESSSGGTMELLSSPPEESK